MSDIEPFGAHDDDGIDEEEEGGGLDLAGLLGGGGFDLTAMLDTAMAAQQQMAEAQAALAEQVVEGRSGGGAVVVRVTGAMEFREVVIRPDAVDPDDVELLADLVLAALHEATRNVLALQAAAVPDLGGLDLGGMLGGG